MIFDALNFSLIVYQHLNNAIERVSHYPTYQCAPGIPGEYLEGISKYLRVKRSSGEGGGIWDGNSTI